MQHLKVSCIRVVLVYDNGGKVAIPQSDSLTDLQMPGLKYNYHDLEVKRRFFHEAIAQLSLQVWNDLCCYVDLEM